MPNWFDEGGQDYARYRPTYPPALASWLAEQCQQHRLALDVGCGNGQLTSLLSPYFTQVLGLDPSSAQLAQTTSAHNLQYQCAPAEQLPLPDASVDLLCAAQAAHWFDLEAFYREARRVCAPGAVLALVSYGVLEIGDSLTAASGADTTNNSAALNARLLQFYHQEIGRWWPAERQLVDSGYATLPFPFAELTPAKLAICRELDCAQLLGYIGTWSALRQARSHGQEAWLDATLQQFGRDMLQLWGDGPRSIVWPIAMRVGRVHA